jgi:hypothetical protein
MPALLDALDSNVQLWHREAHVQSPGYALLEGGEYRFGGAARQAARLHPRNINTRYWWQLSTEPLQPALGPARHTADLVHAHLQALHAEGGGPAEVLLAVPGSMQRDQLSLLLGIVQQCPFDAVGLVNRSVALGSLYGGAGRLFHLEIQLHQAVVTELEAREGAVELRRTLPLPGCGLLQLQERLVEIVAAAFIRQTRFDPRRKAATEQQLYDDLPQALQTLAGAPEANLEVNGYRARVSAGELAEAGRRLLESTREALGTGTGAGHLIVDPLAGLLPGIAQALPGVEVLEYDSLHQALTGHLSRLVQRGEALSFVTTLPCLHTRSQPPPQTIGTTQHRDAVAIPTHLLRGGTARPLGAAPLPLSDGCELYPTDRGWGVRGAGITVNGREHLPGQALAAGDRIHLPGGREWQLIEVLPGEH